MIGNLFDEDDQDDNAHSEVTYIKSKTGNTPLNTKNFINNGLSPNKSSNSVLLIFQVFIKVQIMLEKTLIMNKLIL